MIFLINLVGNFWVLILFLKEYFLEIGVIFLVVVDLLVVIGLSLF